jgi:metal-responsive CopG/Arc/MetJ family transcriptional regulator
MKERITVTIEKELLNWLDKKTKEKIFANRSHGFEFLLAEKIRGENSEKERSAR